MNVGVGHSLSDALSNWTYPVRHFAMASTRWFRGTVNLKGVGQERPTHTGRPAREAKRSNPG
jgi:hypothetical protein